MDPLSEVLSLLRPNSYGFRGLEAGGEWALAYTAAEGIKCFAVETGGCWLLDDQTPAAVWLDPGDFVLSPARRAFRLCSSPDVPAIDAYAFFPRVPPGETAVLNGGGSCTGVGGFFGFSGKHAERLLGMLPPVVHIRTEPDKLALRSSIERLMRELRVQRPGHALIAGHLAQALLIEALRLHLADDAMASAGWLFALGDPQILAAITAMHADPARKWTLAMLAGLAGMSRSSFALRYKEKVGESAMDYLTRWRMMVAADRLTHAGVSVAEAARGAGYESESAFGAAFKRIMGVSPRQHGRAARSRVVGRRNPLHISHANPERYVGEPRPG
ncbi:AraC family transcriptional regulator [Novosphingobium sp.]|uniref:AraC family transcriptional regulator n=1 Tax=Novosphingobium sp. TaxID=1874826 RepID=UPI003B528C52